MGQLIAETARCRIDKSINIDIAFMVQSLNENFNLRRLERYLVMTHESCIRPIVLLSKSDLLVEEEITVLHRAWPGAMQKSLSIPIQDCSDRCCKILVIDRFHDKSADAH